MHGREYSAAPIDGGADGKCHKWDYGKRCTLSGDKAEGTGLYPGEYSDKLDALQLPRKTKLLIDRYTSEHIANGSRYGELAYQLGFSDCAELLLGSPHFKK